MRFKTLADLEERPPTWAERDVMSRLAQEGVQDVFLDVEEAGDEFWVSLLRASHWLLASSNAPVYNDWLREFMWATNLPESYYDGGKTYELIVSRGWLQRTSGSGQHVRPPLRLAAVEHLMDLLSDQADFVEAVNDKARWLRVGVTIEGRRFVPLNNQHLHQEVVRPTLLLLSDPAHAAIDALYRKAFDRHFAHDNAGAITAATSAVEEFLRANLGVDGSQLAPLLQRARQSGAIIPAVEQMAVKLGALRDESDAHTAGTDDPEVAMFAIHAAGAVLLHLAATLP